LKFQEPVLVIALASLLGIIVGYSLAASRKITSPSNQQPSASTMGASLGGEEITK
jgi:hypothetical protein